MIRIEKKKQTIRLLIGTLSTFIVWHLFRIAIRRFSERRSVSAIVGSWDGLIGSVPSETILVNEDETKDEEHDEIPQIVSNGRSHVTFLVYYREENTTM